MRSGCGRHVPLDVGAGPTDGGQSRASPDGAMRLAADFATAVASAVASVFVAVAVVAAGAGQELSRWWVLEAKTVSLSYTQLPHPVTHAFLLEKFPPLARHAC